MTEKSCKQAYPMREVLPMKALSRFVLSRFVLCMLSCVGCHSTTIAQDSTSVEPAEPLFIFEPAEPPLGAKQGASISERSKPPAWLMRRHASWMAAVPDQARLSTLSIPGTHDTCSQGPSVGLAGSLARTQHWSLEDQLLSGIRFLDIRCRQTAERFAIHHGMVDLGLDFADVRDTCEAFLKRHPSECLVMNVQREYTVEGDADFGELFAGYLKGHERYWETQAVDPKLGETRGKIVVLSHNHELDARLNTAFRWTNLQVANDWNRPEFDAKWTGVSQNLAKADREIPKASARLMATAIPGTSAITGTSARPSWFLTFTSAAALPFRTPRTYALEINPRLQDWLAKREAARVGIVVMDFPGPALIDQLIQTNFAEEDSR